MSSKLLGSEIKQDLKNTIITTKYILSLICNVKYGKRYILLKTLINTINAFITYGYIIVPGLIINELTNGQKMNIFILYLGILLFLPFISYIFNTLVGLHLTVISVDLNLNLSRYIRNKSLTMDYELLEKPEINVAESRAISTFYDALGIVDKVETFFTAIISFIIELGIIISLNPIITIFLIFIILANSKINKNLNKKRYLLRKEWDGYSTQERAIEYMMSNFDYAKEIRLFDLKEFLLNIFTELGQKTGEIKIKQVKVSAKATGLQNLLNFFQQGILYIYMGFNVIRGNINIGNMTIYLGIASRFNNSFSAIFNSYLALSNDSLMIQEAIAFLDIPLRQHEAGDKTPFFDKESIIEFRNVSFKYPGSENYILKNFNITIRGGETLCIVGENGSGKSTFIKLLTRLYWPESGDILLNGINISEYNYNKYQQLFAPVFQDFVRYYMTIEKNIILAKNNNKVFLDDVCEKSGLLSLLKNLPKGLQTQVEKLIDEEGFIPSGGEDQRIAIARAVYHDAPFYLLDEPTAALDPIAENEIYTQFKNMVSDKTAILITHRLSAVQLADKIAVFENGNIIEYGTHKQLYKNGGKYTEMFNKQAQFYRDDNSNNI